MTSAIKKRNIGPGELIQPGEKTPFILSREEWLNVQVYVQNTLSLPIDERRLSKLLYGDESSYVAEFQDLLKEFQVLHDHCSTWNDQTYPQAVDLANDIVHYASKVKVYYHALEQLVEDYKKKFFSGKITPEVEAMFKVQMNGCIQLLSHDANKYATNAATVEKGITNFMNWCNEDYSDVARMDEEYKQKYGESSEEVQAIRKRIKEYKDEVDKLQEKYNRDAIIIATSVTYAWVPVVGWVAAGTVDTYYAIEMKKLKEAIDRLKKDIAKENRILQRDIHLNNAIHTAYGSLEKTKTNLGNVVQVIGKIRGHWESMYKDLVEIQNIIDNDLTTLPPIMKDLAINLAIEEWQKVGQEADGFRVNAYVIFQKEQAA